MSNYKLLVVGSFPKKDSKIYGGIARSCQILIESEEFSRFQIIKFDSSQSSSPTPHFLIRLYNALIRLVKFPVILLYHRPKVNLIFCSDGFSALEKGIMVYFSKLFNISVLIFPRAGELINQSNNSSLFLGTIKYLFKKADYFLCQGDEWKKFAIEKIKFNVNNTIIINNWSATNDLIKLEKSRSEPKVDKKINFLFSGWVIKEKGVMELLSAFKNLTNKGYNISLKIVGDGKLMKHSILFSKKYNLNNISLTGWADRSELIKHLEESDVFVLPSWQEGMPNSLIEALASGLPCIATSVGVIPNYLTNNQHALIIKPRDVKNLEISMERLILDPELRKNLSKNGHLLVKNVFLTNNSLNKLSTILNQLV